MKFIREHIIFRCLWFVLALNILNLSVDTPDAQPSHISEDLSVNDMESIVEIVLEQICGINNAILEHDEPGDEENNGLNAKKVVDFSNHQSINKLQSTIPKIHLVKNFISYQGKYSEQFHPEIVPPPPKA